MLVLLIVLLPNTVISLGDDGGVAIEDDDFDKISRTCRFGTSGSDDDEDDNSCDDTIGMDPKFDGYIEVGEDWGVSQQVAGEHSLKTQQIIKRTYEYMTKQVMVDHDTFSLSVRKECKLRHQLCSFWAAIGECDANPSYMTLQCAPACQSCEQISFETRCPFDKDEPGVWYKSGQLNEMFNNIISNTTIQELYAPKVISNDPWIITLEDFATKEECDTLIELGGALGYKRSEDVGEVVNFDGTVQGVQSEFRTSTNAWCVDKCYNHTVTQDIQKRIEDLISIPEINYEYLQLLKYEEDQFYEVHHDYIAIDIDRPQSVRILTIFLYLNDLPQQDQGQGEDGNGDDDEAVNGGTNFDTLDITVTPKRGRIVIWPSVLDKYPTMKDPRTDHEALPVLKGVKYGANAWVHNKDFKTPHSKGCI